MKCCSCKSENLFGNVRPDFLLPLAKKGGNVLTAGFITTQKVVEGWWLNHPGTEKERMILGPIICADCATEMTYFKKLIPALRQVEYAEALQYGYEHYSTGSSSEKSSDEEQS